LIGAAGQRLGPWKQDRESGGTSHCCAAYCVYPECDGVRVQTESLGTGCGQGHSVSAQTILVVEDEFLIRFMLADSLREIGYQVLEAANGDEGLAVLLSGQAVDLMVTDVRMPGSIDGIELTRRSKSLAPARPVIVCSAHLFEPESYPADAFLPKPYTFAELANVIERLTGEPWQTNSQTRSA
jgi:CheY-like chemotaxis protein